MPGDERVLDLASAPARVSLSHERLIVKRDGEPDVVIPLMETTLAVVSHPRVTCTVAALAGLMRHGGSLVVCDESQTPVGLMLPLSVNNEQTRRVLAQAAASRPTVKRLWKQIVRAKVCAQAHNLESTSGSDGGLRRLAEEVRSGDPSNVEGRAAQRYWPLLFDDPMFRRRREAPDQNRLLNYGYAVLRAAVGRSICAAGLHPSLGVHHHGRNNPWVLADDLMEPYRPLVDDEVREIVGEWGGDVALDGRIKERLIGVLHTRIWHDGESRTTLDWVGRTASSVAQVFLGERRILSFPEGLWRDPPGA
jgi:CRISPR-associated protein Cas1